MMKKTIQFAQHLRKMMTWPTNGAMNESNFNVKINSCR
jgi:hypothetical protein